MLKVRWTVKPPHFRLGHEFDDWHEVQLASPTAINPYWWGKTCMDGRGDLLWFAYDFEGRKYA